MTTRRTFIAGLGGAALVRPATASAQTPTKVYRVAIFTITPPVSDIAGLIPVTPAFRAFVQAMRDLGYVEGRNLFIERWAQQTSAKRYGEISLDLVRRKFDLVVTIDNAMAQEMKRVMSTVPIVMATSSDPVQAGIVASLARPGGNITGFTIDTGPEFEAKKLQLLKEALPDATLVAYLGPKQGWESPEGKSIRAAAPILGMTLVHAEPTFTTYFDAFASIIRAHPTALFVATNPTNYANRQIIVDFAAEHRLPGMYPYREFVEAGGLMSYGTSLPDLYRRAAGHVDKILKGAKPADLAVEQPTKFELVINAKTAKALGLTLSPTLLAFADEVIE
jgi:putative tryptophan/tyrosine transport system substrate-binding protein